MKKDQRKKKKRLKPWQRITLQTVLIVCVLLGVFWFFSQPDLESGLAYLKSQVEKDQEQIEENLAILRQQRMQQELEEGSLSITSAFNDSVVMGDSRVYGFSSYGILPADQVLANAGDSIWNISDHIEELRQKQPRFIYISYGVNDMGLQVGSQEGEDGYRQIYEQQIDLIQEACPNARIIVNSIIDPTPAAIENSPLWSQVDDFNRQIQQMAEDRGLIYVNNSSLSQGGLADIYQPDGVHFLEAFYPVWAQNMILAALPVLTA